MTNSNTIHVAIALLLHRGRILIARRNPIKHMGGLWEFPGGKIEPGEDPRDCVTREFIEEFGKEIQVGDLFMETDYTYEGKGDCHFSVFWAGCANDTIDELNEHMDYKWATVPDMDKYDFCPADQPIIDALKNLA